MIIKQFLFCFIFLNRTRPIQMLVTVVKTREGFTKLVPISSRDVANDVSKSHCPVLSQRGTCSQEYNSFYSFRGQTTKTVFHRDNLRRAPSGVYERAFFKNGGKTRARERVQPEGSRPIPRNICSRTWKTAVLKYATGISSLSGKGYGGRACVPNS